MTRNVNHQPPGWERAKVGDLCDADNGRAFKSTEWVAAGLPIVRITNLKDAEAPFNYFHGELEEQHRVRSGDLLFARSGTPGTSFGAHIWKGPDAALNQHIFNMRFRRDLINERFLCYALNQNVARYVAQAQGGVGLAHITKSKFMTSEIPFPPMPEQVRISDAIDSYSTRLDAAVAGLKRVDAMLHAYRASVLKVALEGRLVPTEASLARAEKRVYEPAERLLARILRERRRHWEKAELTNFEAAGKMPKDDKWKAKYVDPVAADTRTLPKLPEGWCWATVDMVGSVRGGVTKGQKRHPKEVLIEVPYLRVANVQRGYLDLREVKTILATPLEVRELRLEPGDVLFNEGGDRDKLGRGWIWGGEIENCIHQNHVFRVRMFTSDVLPRILSWYGNSSGQQYFFDEGKQTTNLASINMTKLKSLPVPIPPKCEQSRIADEVERMLSLADEVSVTVEQDVKRCVRLRQAVLKWAFEGKLADQDPTDEPAHKLLSRIRAGRGAYPADERSGRTVKGAA